MKAGERTWRRSSKRREDTKSKDDERGVKGKRWKESIAVLRGCGLCRGQSHLEIFGILGGRSALC